MTTSRPPLFRSAFRSLAERPFRRWFLAQSLAASGNFTQAAALSWIVLQLTGKAVDLALITTASFLPLLLGGVWAGGLADRYDRRSILLVTQTTLLSISATLAILSAVDALTLPLILILALAGGMAAAVDSPARQVYVLELVGPTHLASAISLYEVVFNTARVVGPALGGLLLATLGPVACFGFNAAVFVPPILVLLGHGRSRGETGPRTAGGTLPEHPEASGHRAGSVREGISYAFRHPVILACLLAAMAGGIIFNPTLLFPLMASEVFDAGPATFGLLISAFGLGALPGAVLAASRVGRPSGRTIRLLVLATGLLMIPLALAPTIAVAAVVAVAVGFTSIWYVAAANALVQLSTERPMQGRVMGVWMIAVAGISPITALLVGGVADLTNVRTAFLVAAAAFLLAAVAGWRSLGQDDAAASRA